MPSSVRPATPAEWAHVRDLRLRGLREDPRAFGAWLHEEEHQPEAFWRDRLLAPTNRTLIGGDWRGICTVLVDGAHAELVGMWVSAEARGSGLGQALVEAAIAHARELRAARIELWVNVEQQAAMRLYERCGFARVGPQVKGTRDPTRTYQNMARDI